MADTTVENINSGTRRKQRRGRSATLLRGRKYTDPDPLAVQFVPPCQHNARSSKFHCSKMTTAYIIKNRQSLYNKKTKVEQDVYLSRLIAPYAPLRRRPKNEVPQDKSKPKNFSCSYSLLGKKKRTHQVCKVFFRKALSLGETRVKNIAKSLFAGEVPKEKRGGDHKSHKYIQKRESVKNFIRKLPATESHYDRAKSKRIYLTCDLNITRLRRIYNDSVENHLKVKKTMFRDVFENHFNIGFSSPSSDVCSYCVLQRNKIKSERDPVKKTTLMTEFRVHKLRANEFYKLLKSEPRNSVTFCFDMQQVHPLPGVPIQDAFYARQISFYTSCVVGVDTKNPSFYWWTEDMAKRGSIEVSSSLLHHLKSSNLRDIHTVRLFCDGCGGQNKNSHLVHALIYWIVKEAPASIKKVEITFPVRGHSFLPADRVFGRVEKHLKQFPFKALKQDYTTIYEKHGKVFELGKDWKLYNYKSLQQSLKKVDGIQNLKRIHLIKKTKGRTIKCTLKAYQHFRFETGEETDINLLKKNQTFSRLIDVEEVRLGRCISREKNNDVTNLLEKQYGNDWKEKPELLWYKKIIEAEEDYAYVPEDVSDEVCDCLEPDSDALRI